VHFTERTQFWAAVRSLAGKGTFHGTNPKFDGDPGDAAKVPEITQRSQPSIELQGKKARILRSVGVC
jgi:hypothetical protein